MARIEVATPAEVLAAEDAFAAQVVAALNRVASRTAETLGADLITAATVTQPPGPDGPTPPPAQDAAAVEDLSIIPALWTVQVTATLMPELSAIYELSGVHLLTALGEAFPDLGDIPAVSGFAASEQRLADAQNRLVGIGDMLWEQARDQLLIGFSAGEDIGQLRNRVQDAAGVSAARAERIARTEVISASNAGSIDQVRAAGLVGTKTWLDTPDERTRCTHRAAGGQTVDLDGKFQLGGGGFDAVCPDVGASYADFPGDPTLPAGEAINCRCSIAYDVDIPALTAGTVNGQQLNGHLYSELTLTEGGGRMPWHIVEDSAQCPASRPYAVVKDATNQIEGCHPSRMAATAQLDALYASEKAMAEQECPEGEHRMPDGECMLDDDMPSHAPADYSVQRWEGTLAIEGVETGDGRMFAVEALTWRDLPVPLMYQKVTSHGGIDDVTVNVGSIDQIWRDGNLLWGRGRIDMDDPNGVEVERKMRKGFIRGVSIDADSIKDADVEFVFPPSKPGADLADDMLRDLFATPELTIFNKGRISAATVVNIPAFQEARLFLIDSDTGALVAAGQEADQEAMGLDAADAPTDAELQEGVTALAAAAYTIEIPDLPPPEWFEEFDEAPPIGAVWVTAEGRIFGFVGPGDVAHRSFRDRKVTIPMGNVDYTAWMNRPTIVAGGKRIATGVITMNCGHASPLGPLDPGERMKHYDNSCSIAAVVAVGESKKHGAPWISGVLMPMDAEQVQRLMACQLSGDWAPHREKPGWREFVAALAVPVPGFARATKVRVVDDVLVSSAVPIQSWEEYQASLQPAAAPELVTAAAVPVLTGEQRAELDAVRDRLGLSPKAKLATIADRVRTTVATAPRPAPVPGTFEGVKKAPDECAPCAAQAQRRAAAVQRQGDRHRAKLDRIVRRIKSLQVSTGQGPAPPVAMDFNPGQRRDDDGRWTDGPDLNDDEDNGPIDNGFDVLAVDKVRTKRGTYHLTALLDREGKLGSPAKQVVALSEERFDWDGSDSPELADETVFVAAAEMDVFASALEDLAAKSRVRPPEVDEDIGGILIERTSAAGVDMAAYHDWGGDLLNEGDGVVALAYNGAYSAPEIEWDYLLELGSDLQRLEASEVRPIVEKMRQMASAQASQQAPALAAAGYVAPPVALHLPGKHPQKNHGDGDGGGSKASGIGRVNGKDMIDSDDRAKVAKEVVDEAKKHEYRSGSEGPRGDEKLRQISERQGYDGKPQVVSKAELDKYLTNNAGAVELHRGVKDSWDWVEMAKPGKENEDIVLPAAAINEGFRSGDLHYGNGQFGNGTYTSTGEEVARNYAGEDGDVIRMALRPDAKIIAWRDLSEEHRKFLDSVEQGSAEWNAFLDPGRYAAGRGWDVVTASGSRPGTTEYLILNRTALVVQEA